MRRAWASGTKRCFDLAFSLGGLIILSPFFLLIVVCIYWDSGKPAFFGQRRVGLGGREFRLYKFRTMRRGAERAGPGCTARDDPRITGVGRFLRKSKLDELPQLINVVKGEMSLVGPRPELPRFVRHYPRQYEEILRVRPGITDPASIEFRRESALLEQSPDVEGEYVQKILPQKLEINRKYINNQSLLYDLGLILKTIGCLIFHSQAKGWKHREA